MAHVAPSWLLLCHRALRHDNLFLMAFTWPSTRVTGRNGRVQFSRMMTVAGSMRLATHLKRSRTWLARPLEISLLTRMCPACQCCLVFFFSLAYGSILSIDSNTLISPKNIKIGNPRNATLNIINAKTFSITLISSIVFPFV